MPKNPTSMDDLPTALTATDEGAEVARQSRRRGYRGPLVRDLIAAALPTAEVPLQFEEVIKRGGVASIAVARDPTLQRRLAVKIMRKDSYAEPVLVRGFLREAQVIGQLDHPNIVAIHGLADDPEVGLHFSMSLVDGETLAERLARSEEPDYDGLFNFLEIIIKVCDALAFAHSRGVIHCDIKPANIMVGEFGQVYLMDWGGAQILPQHHGDSAGDARSAMPRVRDTLPDLPAEATRGVVFGTPAYMAPEQARGEVLDERTDVFSVGALLYHFIMGQAPFVANSEIVGIHRAQACEYRPLDERVHGGLLPRSLFAITRRAMAPHPEHRYQGIEALRGDLVRLVRGGGSFPSVTATEGTVIIREGDEGDAAYIVLEGELEVFKTVDGKPVSLRRLTRGDVFGETAIFASTPRTASVVAMTDVALVRITEDVVRGELDAMKPWMAAFVRILAERFNERETHSLAELSAAAGEGAARSWWKRDK